MTIALSAHPALAPLVGQLAAALPVEALYYPTRRHPSTTLPFCNDLPTMLQAIKPGVCAFLSPYADLCDDVHTCLQANVAVLSAGPVPKADLPIASGGVHRGSPLFAKAIQQRRSPSFGEPVYLRFVAGVQEPGLLSGWWATCRQLAFASDLLGATPTQVHLCANRRGRALFNVQGKTEAPAMVNDLGFATDSTVRLPCGLIRSANPDALHIANEALFWPRPGALATGTRSGA